MNKDVKIALTRTWIRSTIATFIVSFIVEPDTIVEALVQRILLCGLIALAITFVIYLRNYRSLSNTDQ